MATCDIAEAAETTNADRISVARWAGLASLALLYGGISPFLGEFSRSLLYGWYAGFLGCVCLCVVAEPRALLRLKPLVPWMYWVLCYCVWGTVVSADWAAAAPRALRLILRSTVLLSAVAILVKEKRHLQILAHWVGYAAVIGCVLSVWEARNPAFLQQLTKFSSQTYVADVERPAGLWINPNLAAISFLFALLLSPWDRSPWAWLTRVAALVGIYLTASRSGLVLVGTYVVAQIFSLARAGLVQPRRLGIILCGTWAVVLCAIVLGLSPPSGLDVSEGYAVRRFLLEGKAGEDKRTSLSREALEAALSGPWYGRGLFTFSGRGEGAEVQSVIDESQGAHNFYLAVLGETGIVGLVSYLGILGLGLRRSLATAATRVDRHDLALMWLCYFLIGLVWHNQLENPFGLFYIALLYYSPDLLGRNRDASPAGQVSPSGVAHV
jgi:O-antigen ligase